MIIQRLSIIEEAMIYYSTHRNKWRISLTIQTDGFKIQDDLEPKHFDTLDEAVTALKDRAATLALKYKAHLPTN